MAYQGVSDDRIKAVIWYGEVMNITHLELNALIHTFFCSQATSGCNEYRTLVHSDQAP